MNIEAGSPRPPRIFQLAAHPVRWRTICELARSDRRVIELSAALAQPQNVVSYHLGQLRNAGLISARRSGADGRETYYRLDTTSLGVLLDDAARAVQPRRPARSPSDRWPRGTVVHPLRVLFLCTGNSGRSQIAEALLQRAEPDRVAVVSAGSHPKSIHPAAARVMVSYGVDLRARRSKSLTEFSHQSFDYVITLCDKVREVCPTFPGSPETIHWSIPDPATAQGRAATNTAFAAVALDLRTRISHLLSWALPNAA